MCGIYGFAGFEDSKLLSKMGRSILHRGPDGEGSFRAHDFRLPQKRFSPYSMGMRRLSIIDIEGGKQPIFSEDENLVICYNGEIYNYLELRKELVNLGHKFRTTCDTEVALHAFEEWGEDCLLKFNGMFAFSIYDQRTGDCFFARDRCGQKPLYYWQDKVDRKNFVFASEVKALLCCEKVPRRLNYQAVDPFLSLRYVPEPETMFADIFMLPAGHCMWRRSSGALQIRRYWQAGIISEKENLSNEAWLERLESCFFDAIKLVMRADVSVASYLSAGVDSSLIVYAMRQVSDKVRTYSIGFDSAVDETADARQTADMLGTDHHEIICQAADFDRLDDVVYHMDRPVGDALILAFYKMAEAAARDGKVVISGEGADEAFAGYSFQKVHLLTEQFYKPMTKLGLGKLPIAALRATPLALLNKFFIFPAFLGKIGKERVLDFLRYYDKRDIFSNNIALRTLFTSAERYELYTPAMRERHFASALTGDGADLWRKSAWEIEPSENKNGGGDFLDHILKLQYYEWLQDWAIIRQEKNNMAHSLECRLPFLDHRLLELSFQMPSSLKTNGFSDKIIERSLAKKLLPKEIANRRKAPFFLPIEYFFQRPQIRERIASALDDKRVEKLGLFDKKQTRKLADAMHKREFLAVKQVMALVIFDIWLEKFDIAL